MCEPLHVMNEYTNGLKQDFMAGDDYSSLHSHLHYHLCFPSSSETISSSFSQCFFRLQTTAFWLAWLDTEQNLCLPPSEANLTSEWQAASLLQTLSSQLAAYPRATHQSLDQGQNSKMQIDHKLDCAIDAGDMKNLHLGKMLKLGKKLYMRSLVIHIVLYFARRTLLLLR